MSVNDLRTKVADLTLAVTNGYNAMAKVKHKRFFINANKLILFKLFIQATASVRVLSTSLATAYKHTK